MSVSGTFLRHEYVFINKIIWIYLKLLKQSISILFIYLFIYLKAIDLMVWCFNSTSLQLMRVLR